MTLELLFAFLAVFLGVKAIEDGPATLAVICSVGAWICAGITVVLFVVGV